MRSRRERKRLRQARMLGAELAARLLHRQAMLIVPIEGEPVWEQVSAMLRHVANIVEREMRVTKEAGR